MARVERKTGTRTSQRGGRTVIDDTLATVAVFQMEPSQIVDENAPAEGIRLGDQIADAVLRHFQAAEPLPPRPK